MFDGIGGSMLKRGYGFCGEGGGLCCNNPYNTHNPEGGTCKRVRAGQQKSIAAKSDDDRVAELVWYLIPAQGDTVYGNSIN
jgi:hypothetical protein